MKPDSGQCQWLQIQKPVGIGCRVAEQLALVIKLPVAVFIKGRRRREDLLQEVRKRVHGKVKTELRDVGETGEKSLNKIELA
ncbi:MAG: hypothetical protein JNN09_09010 [Alphaproteobacteria bacterium]|nr:hypothetical protein [Alphaproteobacteria bacterium]